MIDLLRNLILGIVIGVVLLVTVATLIWPVKG